MDIKRLDKLGYLVAAILMSAVIAYSTHDRIAGETIQGDALANTLVAHHLARTGEMSFDGRAPFYQREPVPIAALALYMKLYPGLLNNLDITKTKLEENFDSNKRLFYINMIYIAAMTLVIGWLCWMLTGSLLVYVFVVATSAKFFFWNSYYLNNVLTEYVAALIILVAAAFSVRVARNPRWYDVILLGVALGALSLTKASAHYVSIVFLLLIPVVWIYCGVLERSRAAKMLVLVLLSYVSIVGPWVLRNNMAFDDPAITTRGGEVLYIRAVKNTMTGDEFIGSFYVYSPGPVRKVLEKYFGYKKRDLDEDGAYARLVRGYAADEKARASGNMSEITSFYYKAKAYIRFEAMWEMNASPYSHGNLDKYLVSKSLNMIMENPGKHLLMTLPFAWRGLWSFSGEIRWFDGIKVSALNLLSFMAMGLIALVGLYRRNSVYILYPMVGVGLFLFYAIFSHFIPRYSTPLIPLSLVSLGMASYHAAEYLHGKLKKRRSAAS